MDLRYSIIIPVFNRPDEMAEMLASLAGQSEKNFEVVVVEDGSTKPCKEEVDRYSGVLDICYCTKPNTGRSDTRNVGMKNAKGNYFLFFDSDCILPPEYVQTLNRCLQESYSDCFGGPDRALPTFTDMQKAVNFAMTSFLTTGGIRGSGKVCMEKFHPRSFNMGFSREVYEKVGGFADMFGEDIDLSIRIRKAGFQTVLFPEVSVYHKRRVNLKKFFRQVYNFGQARIFLYKLHPESLKAVHALPAMFVLGEAALILLSVFHTPYWLLLLALYAVMLFLASAIKNKSLKIALLSIVTGFVQLNGYGCGFIKAFWNKVILRKDLEKGEKLRRSYNK
ncbi:MAG: glycosyltransferase [Bacteroides sp.]|nr:glycosyltransferase [Ruminococcus flavefaciens]MCM1554087.1 glycosyltransferase [Bacteroides sp.]